MGGGTLWTCTEKTAGLVRKGDSVGRKGRELLLEADDCPSSALWQAGIDRDTLTW